MTPYARFELGPKMVLRMSSAQAVLWRIIRVPPMCLAVHRGVQLREGVSNEMTNFMGLAGLDLILGGKGGEVGEVGVRGILERALQLACLGCLVFILFENEARCEIPNQSLYSGEGIGTSPTSD
ncbi:hypothetical protein I310_00130 [Cryptococcus deuterogattii CA1014]|nr:hypothetical protein I310_00130 [Cryptococcus deuterogattii CA1014]KIS01875.1 hypothetical protein L804_00129 [Cryptococcus deuterogattii 2001/935-1]